MTGDDLNRYFPVILGVRIVGILALWQARLYLDHQREENEDARWGERQRRHVAEQKTDREARRKAWLEQSDETDRDD